MHANGIDYNEQLDQIVLSVRHFNELWVIDHSTTTEEAAGHSGGNSGKGGDLLYRWGNPRAYRAGDTGDQTLWSQHDAQWIEPGLPRAGNLLVFNNGNGRPGGNYSTVDEITPPVDGFGNYSLVPGQAYGPADLTWTVFVLYSSFISGAQRLPNGNTLIDSGAQGTFFEITPDGENVWRYVNPINAAGALWQGATRSGNAVFRATRYAPDYPGLQGKDLTPGDVIELVKEPLGDIDGDLLLNDADPDDDNDGCLDKAELDSSAASELTGGMRDPHYFWDFFDPTLDGTVSLLDVFALLGRFGAVGDPSVDPFSEPPPEPAYHTRFDRGPQVGANGWNVAPSDGAISLFDVLALLSQFGHTCSP